MLQFVDDTLIMCEDSFSNVIAIKAILRCFEISSGLKINFHKFKLACIDVERNSLECYAKTLNCTLMRIPFIYLGLEPRNKQLWEPILNKISARLSAWRERFLSLTRIICILKSVFTVLPLFYFSFYNKASTSVCNEIISIQRRFLWASGKDHTSISWIS